MVNPFPFEFDHRNPDYCSVFEWRVNNLIKIRENPELTIPVLKAHYKENPAQFINDWGCTFDPRNSERKLPPLVPFILFEKQEQWINWIVENWKNGRNGVTEKSRQMGMSWLSIALACTLCLFHDGLTIGFGSRKMEYVDKIGDPKSIFEKGRMFLRMIPKEFLEGIIDLDKDIPHMKLRFPGMRAIISGESGDNIGRGSNNSIHFNDEAAFIEHQELVDQALSLSTNCRQDISTPNGTNNSFYRKVIDQNANKFTYHWRDDPRRDDEWYRKKCIEINDPIIIAQELDLNYAASIDYIVIPPAWVNASIDAHLKLGISPTGARESSLDIADQGKDLNALASKHGILVERLESWSGSGSDIYASVERAVNRCMELENTCLYYDSDGLGASARGDFRIITEKMNNLKRIKLFSFRGSGEVLSPKTQMISGRFNEDIFLNAKSQAWWSLRLRFLETYRAVIEKLPFDKEKIISISSSCNNYLKLVTELSQPTYSTNQNGKILIDKMPDGSRSPNLADAVMMLFAPYSRGFVRA